MTETPDELRKRAMELEAEAFEASVITRGYRVGYEWTTQGRCVEVFLLKVDCPGFGGQKHYKTYTDDYGSWQSCRGCHGNGQVHRRYSFRRPEWDAPAPPA